MVRFRDLSIRSKLLTGFMLTSLVALLITIFVLAWYDRRTFHREVMADLNVLGGVIGENAVSSIIFNDPETARSTLAALRAQPHIVAGRLWDKDGRVFASYGAKGVPATPPADGEALDRAGAAVTRGVTFNGVRVGTVWLRSDLSELKERRAQYFQIAVVVLIGASTIALLLAGLFQRAITRPIKRLLRAEKQVSKDKNYNVVVEKEANDEVGTLIDGFNEMLYEIRVRDAEIRQKHDQEMALARSIQTSVLPRSFELAGYDISAIMLPAEEVGGDFYEFRPTPDGGAWIGVGDVTGHGVTSGLIMMMAQSMFTILCEQQNGAGTPARFLTLLNRAMFYNLRSRLAQDKFMTMVVARLHADGRMVFAGAHTDLLVYRATTKSIDRIATDGLWLGVSEDIGPMTNDRVVTLERGDVALFHTDGVTEARNRRGECFDVDRLTHYLSELHTKRAGDIVTTIANAAWSWAGTPTDDVSLMALKRN